MLFVWLTRLLLCLALLFAVRKGDEPERLVAIIIVAMCLFDIANHLFFGDPTWFEVNPGHFVIDFWALLTLTWVALQANRGWPLWVSATQWMVVMAHFAKLLEIDEARRSYWLLTQLPPLVQLCMLIIGTQIHAARQRRIGQYAAWRPA
jgi:hypothetical protein